MSDLNVTKSFAGWERNKTVAKLFRTSIIAAALTSCGNRSIVAWLLAGYEDLNDAERLSQGPAFRLLGSEKIWDQQAALTSRR